MALGRATRELGADRPLDALTAAEVRDWLLALRETLAPISVAGYVRGLKVFGNWCAAPTLSLRLDDGHGAGVHLIAAHIASIAEIDPDAHFRAIGQLIRGGGLLARIGRVTREVDGDGGAVRGLEGEHVGVERRDRSRQPKPAAPESTAAWALASWSLEPARPRTASASGEGRGCWGRQAAAGEGQPADGEGAAKSECREDPR